MPGLIGTLLAAGLASAEVPLGGYRHLTSPTPEGVVSLNTEALTDLETTAIAQTRLAGQLGERVVFGFELPVLAHSHLELSSTGGDVALEDTPTTSTAHFEPPTRWGGQHLELRINPVAIYDQRQEPPRRRALAWDIGLEASLPWGSESQAGFWAVTPLEAVNWRRMMVALRTTRPIGDHASWQTYAAVGTLHSDKRLLAGQATVTASRHTKKGGVVGEIDFTNTPLANALSVTGLVRRSLMPQLDGAIGLNLPLSDDINDSLQIVTQLRLRARPESTALSTEHGAQP